MAIKINSKERFKAHILSQPPFPQNDTTRHSSPSRINFTRTRYNFQHTMKTFGVVTNFVTLVAVGLNLFVYFYPDILNRQGQCNWHQFSGSTAATDVKYPVLNNLPYTIKQWVVNNFPQTRQNDDEALKVRRSDGTINDIHLLTFGDPQINGNWPLTPYIKRLDNYGNDYYLGHIYATMKNRLQPLHVAVMGDQFSLQWIFDSEFYNRTYRFVERLFPRPDEYKQLEVGAWKAQENYDWQGWMNRENKLDPQARFDLRRYADVYDWFNLDRKSPNPEHPLFINLTGNHDIGYSGDATWQHMARFHHMFGQNNYVINYNKGTPEEWRLVVLDSLTLEGPALQEEFTNYTWSFLHNLRDQENPNFKGPTVLFTHIPLFKREGLCADGPDHQYYVDYEREPYKNGKLRLQNHLLYETSQKVLDIVFPNHDQNGMILTGHDHVGCDDWYNYRNGEWVASKDRDDSERTAIREIVVTLMMGDFNGQTGLLTGHFDQTQHKWSFEFSYCSFVVQHWWWASRVVLLLSVLLQSINFIA